MKLLRAIFLSFFLLSCGNGDKDGQSGHSDTATEPDTSANGESDSEDASDNPLDTSTDTGTSETGTDSESATDIDECVDISWTVDLKAVNILVLLDRSKSMNDWRMPKDSSNTYAKVVQNAVEYIVSQNTAAGTINFALNVFPSPDSCPDQFGDDTDTETDAPIDIVSQCQAASGFDPLGSQSAASPLVTFNRNLDGELEVSDATVGAIQSALESVGQCGGTPISSSLAWAGAYLAEQSLPPEDTYIILATDGAPNCSGSTDVGTCRPTDGNPVFLPQQCLDDMATYEAARVLRAAGYRTFVIGVGDAAQDDAAIFEEVMNGLAYYGATVSPEDTVPPLTSGHYYYPAENPENLDAALEEITNEVIDCEYTVDWLSVPAEANDLPVNKSCADVRLLGVNASTGAEEEIGYTENCDGIAEDALAWYWVESPGATLDEVKALGDDYTKCAQIQLCPTACARLKSTREKAREWSGVSAIFGCEPLVVPVVVE